LSFSYEFDPEVVHALSNLGARISFYNFDSLGDPPGYRFGSGDSPEEGCEVTLRITGENFEPDVATSSLGISPTRSWRKGDPARQKGSFKSRGGWLLEGAQLRDPDKAIAELLKRLPADSETWTSLSHDCDVHVMVAFQLRQMTGYFDLDAGTMSSLADRNCGLDASFYDWGPKGADILD
jgi:hypothetical protein